MPSTNAMQMNDFEQSKPLLHEGEAPKHSTLASLRRRLLPYKRIIHTVNATLLLCYIVALAAAHFGQSERTRQWSSVREAQALTLLTVETRTVLNGTTCPQQRKQLNVFMAAFL